MKIDPEKNIWLQPEITPSLRGGEIHVWRADLNLPAESFAELTATLAPDEKEKAASFRFAEDRSRFIASRGILRKILSGYLGLWPGEIRFSYDRHGNPTLAEHAADLRFNISQAGAQALVAVACGREIGVDLEFVKSDFALLKTAARFFSDAEPTAFQALPSELQMAAFFSVWTRRENYLKAVGEGFFYSPKRFSVSMSAEKEEVFSDDAQKNRFLSVLALPFAPDYRALVAAEGAISEIRLLKFAGH